MHIHGIPWSRGITYLLCTTLTFATAERMLRLTARRCGLHVGIVAITGATAVSRLTCRALLLLYKKRSRQSVVQCP